jgi:hypothetical protein
VRAVVVVLALGLFLACRLAALAVRDFTSRRDRCFIDDG